MHIHSHQVSFKFSAYIKYEAFLSTEGVVEQYGSKQRKRVQEEHKFLNMPVQFLSGLFTS